MGSTNAGRAGRPSPIGVVAVGASAGGLVALERLVTGLPASLPVPVLVVQHMDPNHPSLLPDILARHTELAVSAATDGGHLAPGTLVLAVPGHHLVVRPGGRTALTLNEPVRFVRPSVDVLFTSVADVYGPRAVAVVLTGSGSDGAAGAAAVHRAGGTVIVQDPDTADFPSMPRAATATGAATMVLELDDIAHALLTLASTTEPR